MKKTTPWFNAEHRPHRKGWYQVRGHFAETRGDKPGIVWRYWTGRRWMWLSTIEEGMWPATVSPSQGAEWRGLVLPNARANLTDTAR